MTNLLRLWLLAWTISTCEVILHKPKAFQDEPWIGRKNTMGFLKGDSLTALLATDIFTQRHALHVKWWKMICFIYIPLADLKQTGRAFSCQVLFYYSTILLLSVSSMVSDRIPALWLFHISITFCTNVLRPSSSLKDFALLSLSIREYRMVYHRNSVVCPNNSLVFTVWHCIIALLQRYLFHTEEDWRVRLPCRATKHNSAKCLLFRSSILEAFLRAYVLCSSR